MLPQPPLTLISASLPMPMVTNALFQMPPPVLQQPMLAVPKHNISTQTDDQRPLDLRSYHWQLVAAD